MRSFLMCVLPEDAWFKVLFMGLEKRGDELFCPMMLLEVNGFFIVARLCCCWFDWLMGEWKFYFNLKKGHYWILNIFKIHIMSSFIISGLLIFCWLTWTILTAAEDIAVTGAVCGKAIIWPEVETGLAVLVVDSVKEDNAWDRELGCCRFPGALFAKFP